MHVHAHWPRANTCTASVHKSRPKQYPKRALFHALVFESFSPSPFHRTARRPSSATRLRATTGVARLSIFRAAAALRSFSSSSSWLPSRLLFHCERSTLHVVLINITATLTITIAQHRSPQDGERSYLRRHRNNRPSSHPPLAAYALLASTPAAAPAGSGKAAVPSTGELSSQWTNPRCSSFSKVWLPLAQIPHCWRESPLWERACFEDSRTRLNARGTQMWRRSLSWTTG